ncbi:peptidoglycan recognition protein family protein [Cytobacillus oceanisediminis]|uniref:peptidoglycan recognition protein family protein n=1 Tax=Cytobacillus oceanisediminis TaxID=665099 RepID=UPI003735186E
MIIKQQIIPSYKRPKYTVDGKKVSFAMVPEYITIHETANPGKGANAQAHANLQSNGNSRQASWHIQVDDLQAIQSLPFDEAGIHAGDGTYGNGNRKSIGVEICVNTDGNFEKALDNAAAVVGQLMKQFDIPSHKVVPHKHWSGKNCPTNLLKGRMQEFINRCIAERGKLDIVVSAQAEKEEEKMYKPTSKALKDLTEELLIELTDESKFGKQALNKSWLEDFKKGTLSESNAIGLLFAAAKRGLFK